MTATVAAWEGDGSGRSPRRAAGSGRAVSGQARTRGILARSDLVIMRKELVAVAAESLRLRGEAAGKGVLPDEERRGVAELAAER